MYLGIEIGGTKLQLGVGADDGNLAALWRGTVDVAAGPEGIRRQIVAAVPELLQRAGIDRSQLRGVGIGFGGPVDDATQTIIKSHQIDGWDGFPLADWITDVVGLPAALGNDADVAGLAEALHGAGKGLSPIFYITVGSGIGGGFVIDGEIYRGVGRGAAEIGHLSVRPGFWWGSADPFDGGMPIDGWSGSSLPLEQVASGWAIENEARKRIAVENPPSSLLALAGGQVHQITARHVAMCAEEGDQFAWSILNDSWACLAEAVCHVIAILCPKRIVIGGGVSMMGETVLFAPLRTLVAGQVFRSFAGLTDIVPAALGEEVVVHGAISLARKRFGG